MASEIAAGTDGEVADESPAQEGIRSRASRSTLISLVGQGGAMVLRLGSNLILARLLFPEAFGLMAIVYMIVFALEQFSNIGIPSAIMRYDHGDEPRFLNTAWTIQIIRGFALWFIALAITPWVADFYLDDRLYQMIPVASFAAVILGLQSTQFFVLTRNLQLGRRVAIELISRALSIAFMIALAWASPSVWALVWGGLANAVLVTILSHVWIPGPRMRLAWDKTTVDEVISLGKWVFASSGLSFALAQIDVALLGRLITKDVLGVYSMGIIIPMALRDVAFVILSSVVAPVVAESNREGPETLRKRYKAVRRLTLPAVLLMGLGALIAAPAFFEFLYDERYWDARWMAQLALIRFWFAFLQVSGCISLLSLGDGRTWVISNIVGLVFQTIGCLVGFEMGELRGLLIGMGLGSMVSFLVPAYQLWKRNVANPSAEFRYTLLGAGLVAITIAAVEVSSSWVPLGQSLRTFVVGSIVLAPYGLWSIARVYKELKLR